MHQPIIESSVFQAFQRKDHQAFQIVYHQFYPLIYLVIYGVLGHQQMVEDAFQDTWMKIYQKAHTVKDRVKFQAWAVFVAKNTALNYLKKRQDVQDDDVLNMTAHEEERSPFDTWHQQCTSLENEIIAYKIVYDMTFDDIALLKGMSLSQVYKVYQTGLNKIKEDYTDEASTR
jgi:RNA polymerase sigma factor (sigma-70 family)